MSDETVDSGQASGLSRRHEGTERAAYQLMLDELEISRLCVMLVPAPYLQAEALRRRCAA